MNEGKDRYCLQQAEYIRSHLWSRYSVAVNQVMVATPTGMHTADRNELSYDIKVKTLDMQRNDEQYNKPQLYEWFKRIKATI